MGDELVELNQRRPTSMSMNPWNHSAICAWVLEPADVLDGGLECVLGSLACVGAFVDGFECVVADRVCLCVTGQVVVRAVRVYDDLGVSVCECGAQLSCSR